MAQLNYINIAGHSKLGVNLTDIVGPGAPNKPDDVALIQAMLRYIATGLGIEEMGVQKDSTLPEPTGRWDFDTEYFATGYKAYYATQLLNDRNRDFRIHPASYKGKIIRNPAGPLMMITHMHLYALLAANRNGHGDYIKEIVKMLPLFMKFRFARPHWSDS